MGNELYAALPLAMNGVPRDPPGLDGEILVSYRFPQWARLRRGFARITPGLFLLRSRFDPHNGLVLRPAGVEQAGSADQLRPPRLNECGCSLPGALIACTRIGSPG